MNGMNGKWKMVLPLALLVLSGAAWAHGGSEHRSAPGKQVQTLEEKAFGQPGEPKKVTRTIQVDMHDNMRFISTGPGVRRAGGRDSYSDEIRVNVGDTVRFIVLNKGKAMHEMVIGTMAELKQHAELMRKYPNMEHDEPYMAHAAPADKAEIVWQFTKPGVFDFACLIAGHYDAGMMGKVTVK